MYILFSFALVIKVVGTKLFVKRIFFCIGRSNSILSLLQVHLTVNFYVWISEDQPVVFS